VPRPVAEVSEGRGTASRLACLKREVRSGRYNCDNSACAAPKGCASGCAGPSDEFEFKFKFKFKLPCPPPSPHAVCLRPLVLQFEFDCKLTLKLKFEFKFRLRFARSSKRIGYTASVTRARSSFKISRAVGRNCATEP